MVHKIIAIAVAVGLFVVMERLFALRRDQKVLRPGWRVDALHAVFSHTLSQVGIVIGVGLLFGLLGRFVDEGFQARVAAQPHGLQLLEALLMTQLVGYAVHRAAHTVPWLWRFHRVHHSSEQMDWLASARVHPVDIVLIRSAEFGPMFLMGFSQQTFGAFAAVLSVWALVIHANVKWRFGPLKYVFSTPEFHHWHHTNDPGARDKNFAGLLPLVDALFGTLHLPGGWPRTYGVDEPPPAGYLAQLADPFRRRDVGAAATRR